MAAAPQPVMRGCGTFLIVLLACASASAEEPDPVAVANACAACHGTDGRSDGAIPSLAGMPAAELVAKMTAFREGGEATVMGRIAPGYSPAEIDDLAAYFADLGEAK